MARRPRIAYPGAWHHVVNQGCMSTAQVSNVLARKSTKEEQIRGRSEATERALCDKG